ncbi:holo-ACP synthase [Alteromonas halophila]|uniref:Holo-[acyl-carrier-protein] synthase n=1 Tax=Alteromonas halophila TaxID=516698 RepID=A0A918JIV7_9ALTE|nr:holo-ACP synthase [Alteromonas halophila]GGW80830.1 holo-[acyl-carrier-protein] synthase [Alteromonas halophila]
MAVAGLGTDIVEIARLEESLRRSSRLVSRILTDNEQHLYAAQTQPVRYLAKRFAMKEAAVKALGTGIGNGIGWQHIETINDDMGAPQLIFHDRFKTLCEQRGIIRHFVSVSDEKHYAVATVILETDN